MMTEVTVVITLYNKEKFIEDAIKSVLAQSVKNWHLLILDDASTDQSVKKVEPFLKHKNITLIQLKQNLGQTNLLNYALTLVETPYFLQLDADDWLPNHALKKLMEAAKKHSDAGMLYANHICYTYDEQDQLIEEKEIMLEQYKDRYQLLEKINEAMAPRFYWTEKLKEVGGWMAQTKGDMIVEDVQITLRLARLYPCVWINDFLYHRRKYTANQQKFDTTKSLRVAYRYHLFNQVLLEWGDEYVADWQQVNNHYYLKGLVPNSQKQTDTRYTIVIPNYNHADTILSAVKSALTQTLEPEEILVIDDASTDNSLKKLASIKSSKLKVIPLKKNEGISHLLNHALTHIKTPYFLQLDSDDWLNPQTAQRLVIPLSKQKDAAFAYGNHALWKEDNELKWQKVDTIEQPSFSTKYDWLLKLGYMVNPRCYRTTAVKKVGGWITNDPWQGRYFEDARMILRLISTYKWVHVNESLHNVRVNPRSSGDKIKYYNRLRKDYYEKMLLEWGNQYKAVWKMASTGRIVLERLEKI